MQKAIVHFQGRGPSGNIYCLLGRASDALIRQGRSADSATMTQRVVGESQSYEESLQIIYEYVKLIDDDGLFRFGGGKC